MLGWVGICALLYFFLLVPLLKDQDESPPAKQQVEQSKTPIKEETTSTVEQQPAVEVFKKSFSQAEIDAAQQVVDQFLQVIYEGKRNSRQQFVNQLVPYTTENYLATFKQANGLGKPIKIKEKYMSYIEHGTAIPEGWIGFNCTVLTDTDTLHSTMYFLRKEHGTWRVTEEADGIVPED